jgi:hypothetical protein
MRSSTILGGSIPRDATRGGVNAPALPAHSGREGPLSINMQRDPKFREVVGEIRDTINQLESSNRAGD